MAKFLTIRQAAKTGNTPSEHYLRLMLKQGRLPHIKSGNRVLINMDALFTQLDTESRGEKDDD